MHSKSASDRKMAAAWLAAGVLVVCGAVGMTVLSERFVYGRDHELRPILAVLGFTMLGWSGFAVAVWLAMRRWLPVARLTMWIIAVGVAARIALFPSGLIQENDCYRYVLDGHAMLAGVNPFAHSPDDVSHAAPPAFGTELQRDDARLILSRIGYPSISTIYPPVAQVAFALGAWLTPWDWLGQRIVFVGIDILAMVLLVLLLRYTGRPTEWCVVYAWNPLLLKEVANSAHVDALVAFMLVATVLALSSWEMRRGGLRLVLASLACACAIVTKLYPAVLLPLFCVFVLRRAGRMGPVLGFVGACVATVAVSYLPFLDVGLAQLSAGLREYTSGWTQNEGVFGVLEMLVPHARVWGLGVVAVVCGLMSLWLYRGQSATLDLARAMQIVLVAWFLMTPAVFPWYAIGLIAVSALHPRIWMIALSGLSAAYYLLFYYEYHQMAPEWETWTRLIEHGLIWSVLVIEELRAARGKGSTD